MEEKNNLQRDNKPTLLSNDSEQNKLLDLFLLKSSTEWLEKQNWISSPYGGDNFLEDFIFRVKHLSGQEWKSVFQDQTNPANVELMTAYFEMLKTIDPHIRTFCDSVLKSTTGVPVGNSKDSGSLA